MGKNYTKVITFIYLFFVVSCKSVSTVSKNDQNLNDVEIKTQKSLKGAHRSYDCGERKFVIDTLLSEEVQLEKVLRCLIQEEEIFEIAKIIESGDYGLIRYLSRREFFIENFRGKPVFESFLRKGKCFDCLTDYDGDCLGSSQTVFTTKFLVSMILTIEGEKPRHFIRDNFNKLPNDERLKVVKEYDFPLDDTFGYDVVKKAWEEGKIVLKPINKK